MPQHESGVPDHTPPAALEQDAKVSAFGYSTELLARVRRLREDGAELELGILASEMLAELRDTYGTENSQVRALLDELSHAMRTTATTEEVRQRAQLLTGNPASFGFAEDHPRQLDASFLVGMGDFHNDRLAEAATAWYAAAARGHILGMHSLAYLYARTVREDEAQPWWRAAAEAGHAPSGYNLGLLLERRGRETEAEECWRAAVADGHVSATRRLGTLCHRTGRMSEAETLFRTAAESGDVEAMTSLGAVLADTGREHEAESWWNFALQVDNTEVENTPQLHDDEEPAAEDPGDPLTQAAASGDPAALTELGTKLAMQGYVAEAEAHLQRAAASGHGIIWLALLYEQTGRLAEAEQYYRQAAEAGDVSAMAHLGGLYARQHRSDDAATWWLRAAEAGDIGSMANLGTLLTQEGPTPEGEAWWLRAAEHGSSVAMRGLAWYHQELGNPEEANAWAHRAEETERETGRAAGETTQS